MGEITKNGIEGRIYEIPYLSLEFNFMKLNIYGKTDKNYK